jgi:hypothetical protein
MNGVLDAEDPDLVVLNGDLINGDSVFADNGTHYIDQIVGPMVDRDMKWASVYGNHDHQPNLDGNKLLAREQTWRGCLTRRMVNESESGVTNYYLPVYQNGCRDPNNSEPALILWFFDSRGGFYYQGSDQPNWVDESVVEWFNATKANLNREYDRVIPSLAFVHIPINATVAFEFEPGVDPNYQTGLYEERYDPNQSEGWCSNGTHACPYGGQDVIFMQALAATSGMLGLFYGHDHGNTWCFKWESELPGVDIVGNGIKLCYGQHTGYGGYSNWIRGSRQIHLTRDDDGVINATTDNRLESGEIVGAVSLNATLNSDSYTETRVERTYEGQFSSTTTTSGTTDLRIDLTTNHFRAKLMVVFSPTLYLMWT